MPAAAKPRCTRLPPRRRTRRRRRGPSERRRPVWLLTRTRPLARARLCWRTSDEDLRRDGRPRARVTTRRASRRRRRRSRERRPRSCPRGRRQVELVEVAEVALDCYARDPRRPDRRRGPMRPGRSSPSGSLAHLAGEAGDVVLAYDARRRWRVVVGDLDRAARDARRPPSSVTRTPISADPATSKCGSPNCAHPRRSRTCRCRRDRTRSGDSPSRSCA